MKYLIICTALIFLILKNQSTDEKMKGKYRMEYEQNLTKNNCVVIFDENIYEKQFPNGKKIKGSIEYQKNFAILSDKKSTLQMSLPIREIKNDTIYFRTLDSLEVINQKQPLLIFTGKLIKIN